MRDSTGLSEQQIICLSWVEKGFSSKDIAQEMGISPATVDTYLKVAMQRLGTNRRREAARIYRLTVGEQGLPQKLGSQSTDLVEDASIASMEGPAETAIPEPNATGSTNNGWLPSLGGKPNDLTATQTISKIMSLAIIMAGGSSAIVAAGLWIMGLLH